MTPAPTPAATPVNLTVAHPATVSAADILNIVNSVVDTDAPVVIQALPLTAATSNRVAVFVTLGEIGIGIVNQIAQLIHQKHVTASPAAV